MSSHNQQLPSKDQQHPKELRYVDVEDPGYAERSYANEDGSLPTNDEDFRQERLAPDAAEDQPTPKRPSELEETDLAALFGADGPIARNLEGYELRPSQLEMAEAIKRALLQEKNALIEAPTGTGKSIAYLIPAILSGKTVVVATANKSLQSQLFQKDIPFLREVLGKPIHTVVVKGRSNYVCTYKWDDENFQQQRFAFEDREDEQVTFIRRWLTQTKTGDVDDLPFVLNNDLRPRLVSYSDDCLHSDCRYYHENCWINQMRDQAADAQVLITNHHLLLNALELGPMGERILPPAGVYIVDEAHQLEQTATAVFEATVTDYTVRLLLSRSVFRDHCDNDELEEIRSLNMLAFSEVENLTRAPESAFRIESELETLKQLVTKLDALHAKMQRDNPYSEEGKKQSDVKKEAKFQKHGEDEISGEQRAMYELAVEALGSTILKLRAVATAKRDDHIVRYAARIYDRRHVSLELHAAPIDPAPMLHEFLFNPDLDTNDKSRPQSRSVICTSATLSTNQRFDHFKARCGLHNVGEEKVLPAVFDYSKQTLLYQPELPAYQYKNASRYYDAVSQEITRLLEISRGRALCLFTSWSGLQQVKERLTDGEQINRPIWPLRAQGEAPRDALLAWFKETPYSVMLATRSFWEGVDIPGDDLSLVVLDKMPFPTPSDPLHSARMKAIEENGGSSFGQYMLPLMTLTLKQGFGRLVRRSTDVGVVAMLDERLTSKGYGMQARKDLPPSRFTRSFKDVHQFFRQAFGSQADFALNLSATGGSGLTGDMHWRWQLLRLLDGKMDSHEGKTVDPSPAHRGELFAAIDGLTNLRRRVEKAGRPASQFGVEVRASVEAIEQMENGDGDWSRKWAAECARWKELKLLPICDREVVAEIESEKLDLDSPF